MTLQGNISRHEIGNYLADAHAEDIDEYQDYTNAELIQMFKDSGWYEEFIGYIS